MQSNPQTSGLDSRKSATLNQAPERTAEGDLVATPPPVLSDLAQITSYLLFYLCLTGQTSQHT